MYHVPSATIIAVRTRFLSTTNQYFELTCFWLNPIGSISLRVGSSDSRHCSKKYPDRAEFYEKVTISEIIYQLGTFLVTDMWESEKEFGKIIKIV